MPTLKIPEYELNLKAVLQPGQSYRWRSNYGVFYGVVDGILLELKRVNCDEIHWECLGRSMRAEGIDIPEKLREYFQLDVSLMDLWDNWSAKDLLMADLRHSEDVQGLRILKQEPLEALLATICAINAGIDRSSIIINSMAQLYGDLIAIDQSTVGPQVVFLFPELRYAFPTLLQLTRVQDLLEPFFCKHLVPPAAKCLRYVDH
ncbi:8-oxoguanine DNA glycosylase protein [Cooperia oncophora]